MGLYDNSKKKIEKPKLEPEPINPPEALKPITAAAEKFAEENAEGLVRLAESEAAEMTFLKSRLSLDLELCKSKGYDFETFVRLTYGL